MTTHEEISQRARQIWEREGRPEGRDMEHWLQAEAELRQESVPQQNGPRSQSDETAMMRGPNGSSSNTGSKEEAGRKRGLRRGK
jgi:hypothetical protein